MKDITLKIVGSQYIEEDLEEQIEFITEGKMYDKDSHLCLEYDETELVGFEGCITRLLCKQNSIEMSRVHQESGEIAMEMRFEEGKRITSEYETPFGNVNMEILTKEIKNQLNLNGTGVMAIEYDLSLSNMIEARNTLSIEILQ